MVQGVVLLFHSHRMGGKKGGIVGPHYTIERGVFMLVSPGFVCFAKYIVGGTMNRCSCCGSRSIRAVGREWW
jgi:hypothetical protein